MISHKSIAIGKGKLNKVLAYNIFLPFDNLCTAARGQFDPQSTDTEILNELFFYDPNGLERGRKLMWKCQH